MLEKQEIDADIKALNNLMAIYNKHRLLPPEDVSAPHFLLALSVKLLSILEQLQSYKLGEISRKPLIVMYDYCEQSEALLFRVKYKTYGQIKKMTASQIMQDTPLLLSLSAREVEVVNYIYAEEQRTKKNI